MKISKVFLCTNLIVIIKMTKINVELDGETHRKVKIKAIETGKSMKEYILDVLKEAIAKEEKERG